MPAIKLLPSAKLGPIPCTTYNLGWYLAACQITHRRQLRIVLLNRHPCVEAGRRVVAYAVNQMSITTQNCTHSMRTSVISNFTLPIASPSAIAKKEVRVGCPTIDASVSRCWWVSQSLKEGSSVYHPNKMTKIMLTISTNLHGLKHKKTNMYESLKRRMGTYQYPYTERAL